MSNQQETWTWQGYDGHSADWLEASRDDRILDTSVNWSEEGCIIVAPHHAAMIAAAPQMLAMLEELEKSKQDLRFPWDWSPGKQLSCNLERFTVCPICDRIIAGHEGKEYFKQPAGHTDDCRLALLLKQARGEELPAT